MTMILNKRAARLLLSGCAFIASPLMAQDADDHPAIPAVLGKDITYDASGRMQIIRDGDTYVPTEKRAMNFAAGDLGNANANTLTQMIGKPQGTETGIAFDFDDPTLNGTLAFGEIDESQKDRIVSFANKTNDIRAGKAVLDIKAILKHEQDILHFAETKRGLLGYRVLDAKGRILYDGRVAFTGSGPYTVVPTVIEGPFVNLLSSNGAVISFETQMPVQASVTIGGHAFSDAAPSTHHEIAVTGLSPATAYDYAVHYGERSDSFRFRTAVPAGDRTPFTFALTANTRGNSGGGERDLGGVNYWSTRAAMHYAARHGTAFMQLMGGNTTGNNTGDDKHLLEYANLKRALEPIWSGIPIYVGMGNHEANYYFFQNKAGKSLKVDRFPYATQSGEATFAKAFVNPDNGPLSEDGASYDPDPKAMDFPTYEENVYSYTYGRLGMIVLQSEYWKSTSKLNGSPEGYVMDQQMAWLKKEVDRMEKDPNIDHVFVNLHSNIFPNGDHGGAGMWYSGRNDERPIVAGVRMKQGIIERRDELIDAAINHSKKVVGFLVGGEHNFSALNVTPDMPMYPDAYKPAKLKLSRSFYYINSGGGGTYGYARMDDMPWSSRFEHFNVPPTLSLIHVDGNSVTLDLVNPESDATITTIKLR